MATNKSVKSDLTPVTARAHIDSIKAAVKSKIIPKGKFQEVRAAQGDMILIHDGVRVLAIKTIEPMDEMSVPASRIVFVGNDKQIQAEIKKLRLINE